MIYILEKNNVEKIETTKHILKKLSTIKTPPSLIALGKMSIHKYGLQKFLTNKIICFNSIQDPGNIGAIIRTAIAAGFKYVMYDENCSDPYSAKVIRSSAGAIFKANFFKTKNISKDLEFLKKNKYTIIGTTSKRYGENFQKITNPNNLCIIFGNEGRGINKEILKIIDREISIPLKNDIESLNVAISSAIILFNLTENI